MARKEGGESEGIVLYPSRSPSLGWKPTPLAPLVRGVKAMRPTRGWKKSPPDKGGQGGCSLDKDFSNNHKLERIAVFLSLQPIDT